MDALRERGLKVGLYYSHSDWNHPDHASLRHPEIDQWSNTHPGGNDANPTRTPHPARGPRRPGSVTSPTVTTR